MIKDGYKTYVGANSSLFYFQKKKSSSFLLHLKIEWRPTKENVMGKREKGSKCNLDKDSVPSEKLKLFHGLGVHGHYGVVVVDSLIHNKPVRRLFAFQNRGREVLLPRFPAFPNKNSNIKQTSQSNKLLSIVSKEKEKKKKKKELWFLKWNQRRCRELTHGSDDSPCCDILAGIEEDDDQSEEFRKFRT